MSLISVSGKRGCGKDTLANLLVKKHGFTKISLADPLRDLCCKVFDIPMEWFLDRDKKDSEMPSKIELDYKHLDNITDYVENNWGFVITNEMRQNMDLSYGVELETPRDILKFVGTELLRKHLRDDLWIVLALTRIKEIGQKVVIADVRFDNERAVFSRAGGTLLLIKRPDVESEDSHISENMGAEDQYDTVFNNIGSLNMFESDVDLWYTLKRETFNRLDLKYAY